MPFKGRRIVWLCSEAVRCILGSYTPWEILKKQMKWTNLILFALLCLLFMDIVAFHTLHRFIIEDSSVLSTTYTKLTLLDVYYGNYKELIRQMSPQTLFRFALYVQSVKFFFTLIILITCSYVIKARQAYSLYQRRHMTRISSNVKPLIPNVSLHILLNPLFFLHVGEIGHWDLPHYSCPVNWETVLNGLFNKISFPVIKHNFSLVRTQDLSFMYHGDSSWDIWFHYILKRHFPSLYRKHLISSNTLTKSQEFERSDPRILKGVSVSIRVGKFTTILGCNGSSKSVFLKTIIHLLEKYEGRIVWIGSELKTISRKSFYKNVAYVDQNNIIHGEMSVYDYVACGLFPSLKLLKFQRDERDDAEILRNLEKMEILQHKDKSIKQLSGGEKQKAVLARVLTQKTDVIILDEPTTYLDINSQYKILNILKRLQLEENKTIITVLHDINQAQQFSDEVIIMDEGQVYAQGKTEDIINKKNIERVFGTPWN